MSRFSRRDFLRLGGRCGLGFGLLSPLSALLTGCESMGDIAAMGASVAASGGLITHAQADSIAKSSRAVARTFQDITPEQEYYIGRTVGATILRKYPPHTDPDVNRYVNVLGQTLARASDLPETYGGYHFLVLNSDDINALSAPGGLIFVTRGLLRCCAHEDAVAAVLAHEIGHVQLKHGLQSISKSRITTALTTIGLESAKTFGGEELANLTSVFEDSIADITRTLINRGYSRAFEHQADAVAVTTMRRVGYDPNGLIEMLKMMAGRLQPGRPDFAKTHPSPQSRMAEVRKYIGGYRPVQFPASRQARFERALGSI